MQIMMKVFKIMWGYSSGESKYESALCIQPEVCGGSAEYLVYE
jgi:hypothetical protein